MPLSIESFWKRPNLRAPNQMGEVEDPTPFGRLARKHVAHNILLGKKPKQVNLPKVLIYEEPIDDHAEQCERDIQTRNSQMKSHWETN